MKKTMIALLVVSMCILVACSDIKETNNATGDAEKINTQNDKDADVDMDAVSTGGYTGIESNNSGIYLYDYINEKVIRKAEMGKTELVFSYGKINNGYYCIYVKQEETEDKEDGNQSVSSDLIEVSPSIDPLKVKDMYIVYYDDNLKKTGEVSFYDFIKKNDNSERLFSAIDCVVSPDGRLIAFPLSQEIYYIDIENSSDGMLDSFNDEDISVSYITFTDNEHIAFKGDLLDNDTDTVLGFVDMNDECRYQTIRNYQGDGIYHKGNMIWITEWEKPGTNSTNGKMYAMKIPDGKLICYELDGLESTLAALGEDGLQMAAVKYIDENSFRIRVYDTSNMKVLYERKLKSRAGVKAIRIDQKDGKFIIVYCEGKDFKAVYAS